MSVTATGNISGLTITKPLSGSTGGNVTVAYDPSGNNIIPDGEQTITIAATGVNGESTSRTFTLNVAHQSGAPTVTLSQALTDNSDTLNLTNGTELTATTVATVSVPSHGTLDTDVSVTATGNISGLTITKPLSGSTGGNVTVAYDPSGNNIIPDGEQTITIAATGVNGESASRTFTLNVAHQSGAPTVTLSQALTDNSDTLNLTNGTELTATTVATVSVPSHGTLDTDVSVTTTGNISGLTITKPLSGSTGGNVTVAYDPSGNNIIPDGDQTITIAATGVNGESASRTFTLNVAHQSGAPTVTLSQALTDNSDTLNLTNGTELTATTVATVSVPSHGTLDTDVSVTTTGNISGLTITKPLSGSTGGNVTVAYDPSGNNIIPDGEQTITIAATGVNGESASRTFTLNVAHQSGAPTVTLSQALTDNSDTLNLTNGTELTATTVATVSVPSHGTLDTDVSVTTTGNISGLTITKPLSGSTGGNVTVAYDPSGNNIIPDGEQTITIAATGVNGESASRTFTLNVAHQSGAPTVTLSQALTDNSDTLNLTNGTELTATTVATVSVPSHGELDSDVSVTTTGNISGLTITKPLSGSTGGNVTVAYDPSGNNIIPDGEPNDYDSSDRS